MTLPVHKSVMVRHLVLGADRDLAMSLLIVTFALMYGIGGLWVKLGIACFGGVCLLGLRALAVQDPWYVPVMIRSWRLVGRYPARGSLMEKTP